jgi:hypothetical protein
VTILDGLSPSLQTEIQLPLELIIMMELLLMPVMFVFMTGMELTGLNGAKTLRERQVVTILDFLSPSLMMETQWPLEQYLMMALLLMQVMFVYIIIMGRWAIMMVVTIICVG